ncbi:MAG: pyridoxamine 5'-phosphate oxidase family protein [Rudaea sp.]
MLEELRDRMAAYLSQHNVCVISTRGTAGAWAVPAVYRSRDLVMDCLLPRWADAGYHIEQDPQVLLIICDSSLRWMQYRGTAHFIPAPNWVGLQSVMTAGGLTDDRYVAIRVKPERIDLVDESKEWGARETLDF